MRKHGDAIGREGGLAPVKPSACVDRPTWPHYPITAGLGGVSDFFPPGTTGGGVLPPSRAAPHFRGDLLFKIWNLSYNGTCLLYRSREPSELLGKSTINRQLQRSERGVHARHAGLCAIPTVSSPQPPFSALPVDFSLTHALLVLQVGRKGDRRQITGRHYAKGSASCCMDLTSIPKHSRSV